MTTDRTERLEQEEVEGTRKKYAATKAVVREFAIRVILKGEELSKEEKQMNRNALQYLFSDQTRELAHGLTKAEIVLDVFRGFFARKT
ncbi:MAG: hypothetical protein HYW95_02680 [Candidatus Wildermuthbacteria bacterium]|nr:hypothetical protein [Candidatus Wildermuthbacteria bacterium]